MAGLSTEVRGSTALARQVECLYTGPIAVGQIFIPLKVMSKITGVPDVRWIIDDVVDPSPIKVVKYTAGPGGIWRVAFNEWSADRDSADLTGAFTGVRRTFFEPRFRACMIPF